MQIVEELVVECEENLLNKGWGKHIDFLVTQIRTGYDKLSTRVTWDTPLIDIKGNMDAAKRQAVASAATEGREFSFQEYQREIAPNIKEWHLINRAIKQAQQRRAVLMRHRDDWRKRLSDWSRSQH